MKANEAPEKIYIPTILAANTVRYKEEGSIEYTRTDVFVEKACDAYCRLCDTKECGDNGECIWVEKFRKRLKK